MIIETLLNMINLLLTTIFGLLPNIPSLPSSFQDTITYVLDIIFNNGTALLGFFVHINTLKILAPIGLIIFNLDKIYHLIMFVLKKLPIGVK